MLSNLLSVQIDPDGGELAVAWADGHHRIAGIPVVVSSNVPEGKVILGDFTTVQQVFLLGHRRSSTTDSAQAWQSTTAAKLSS